VVSEPVDSDMVLSGPTRPVLVLLVPVVGVQEVTQTWPVVRLPQDPEAYAKEITVIATLLYWETYLDIRRYGKGMGTVCLEGASKCLRG
jgi:hypothetical protein